MMLLAMVTVAVLLIAIGQIFVTGTEKFRLFDPATVSLLWEMAAVFVMIFIILKTAANFKLRAGLTVLLIAAFTWLHRSFLPLLLSGAYIILIIMTGRSLRQFLDKKHWLSNTDGYTWMVDFMFGCGILVSLFCLMSLAGIGSIPAVRTVTFILACILTGKEIIRYRKRRQEEGAGYGRRRKASVVSARRLLFPDKPLDMTMAAFWALTITMLLLQAGRMNICVDYDSLHYGLRSEYILNNGGGIYENLGNVNVVYTYSKGLEILLLPISGLPSYGFFLAFNLWIVAGVLAASGLIASMFVGKRYGLLCAALLSCIPGITNMGITAKTDVMTALFQLMLAAFLLLYIEKRENFYLVLAADAFLVTMILKPTALVFSTVLAGSAGLYLLGSRRLRFNVKERFLLSLLPMVSAWLLTWLRTLRMTGLPLTSVFNSIWAKLGFQVKYPFLFDGLPSNGGAVFSKEGVKHLLKRLYGVLAAPVGEDMAHVNIAWGTPILLVFLVFLFLILFLEKKQVKETERARFFCLTAMFFGVGAASLAALYLLWQVDGNYFILLYCLMAILFVAALGKLKRQALVFAVTELLLPVVLFNIVITAVSNWGGALGLTPKEIFHAGYYDHRAQAKEKIFDYGNISIWETLAADEKNRVLIFGEQPDLLLFPCNVQSYTDIEGSGGNYYLSSGVEALSEFLIFAEMDYIYVGSSYLKPGTEAWRNFTGLLTAGYLTDLQYENGNLLARFTAVKQPDVDGEALLFEFSERYWPGDQM